MICLVVRSLDWLIVLNIVTCLSDFLAASTDIFSNFQVILPSDYTTRLQEDIEAILDLDVSHIRRISRSYWPAFSGRPWFFRHSLRFHLLTGCYCLFQYNFKLEQQIMAAQPKRTTEIRGHDGGASGWPPAPSSTVDGGPADQLTSSTSKQSTNANSEPSSGSKPKSGHAPPPRPPPPAPSSGSRVDPAAGVSLNPLLASVSYRPLEPQKAQLPGATSSVETANPHRGFRVEEFEPTSANPFDSTSSFLSSTFSFSSVDFKKIIHF